MVSREQLLTGVLAYLDQYVIPVLPTSGKWAIGTLIVLISGRFNQLLNDLMANPVISSLGIFNPDGTINSDSLFTAIRTSADKYGALTITVPVIGTLSFNADDISNLQRCVNGEANGRIGENRITETL